MQKESDCYGERGLYGVGLLLMAGRARDFGSMRLVRCSSLSRSVSQRESSDDEALTAVQFFGSRCVGALTH